MKKTVLVLIVILGTSCFTSAQVTTSSVSGKVIDMDDKVVVGATVQAVHEPSGASYGGVTNTEGRYTIQGMRVGGPYNVKISLMGYETELFSGIILKLGETTNISTTLRDASESLSEVVITARSAAAANKTGAAASMNAGQIARMPSITHGIADVVRLNPQVSVSTAGAMSFAGTNNRYNSFQIDGAMNNDVFGLAANGANGGQAGTQPVSMETIEQIRINVAPYDVRQSGFTGGTINAVTKSGTNTLHGSVYGFGNNRSLIGAEYTLMNGKASEKYNKQSEYQAGVTLGGAIVKNKLFFFVNYERANKTYPDVYGPGDPASNIDATQARNILNKVKELARAQGVSYNGDLSNPDVYTKSDKAGVKLDWNIGDGHKASFRWSLVSAKQLSSVSTASSLNSSDYSYDFVSGTNTFVAELQSRFSADVSNEFRVSYVRVRDRRDPGDPFPMISVSNAGNGYLNIGNERSSMLNSLDQDIWSFTDNLTWYRGNHTLTFGTHNEFYGFANMFIQDAYGSYYYNGEDDFMAGKINRYRFARANVSVTGDPRWKATFGAAQLGFYAQDKWNVTDRLYLSPGIRVDIPLFFDTPAENVGFNEYAASKGTDYKTNRKPSGAPLFSPRLGFRWDAAGSDNLVLRGGAGIFTGRIPFVWLSNNFSNTGIQLSSFDTYSTEGLSLILDPDKQMQNADKLTASGTQTINVLDKDFKFAQNLRVNLGLDFEAGGIDWTIDAIYSKTLNDILYRNTAYDTNGKTFGETVPGADFDRRPMFERVTAETNYAYVYVLSNTDKGYSYNLSLKGEKRFDFGLDLMASYTFTQSKSLISGTSSVAQSNWAYNYTRNNPNDPESGFSAFNIPHRINASVFFHKTYGKAWSTVAGLIYSGFSGAPYSIHYNGDLNGDSSNGNDLMFIPTDAQIDRMPFLATDTYSAETQKAGMKAWIAADPYLSGHRGEYFERYADNEKFEHHFDLHLAQKYGFNVGGNVHYIELSFDIMNVGNMLDKKWGRYAAAGGSATYYSPVTYSKGTFQFLRDANYNMRSYDDYYSRWRAQVGLKYTF